MPAPAIDRVYVWGDFFGFEGANAFTQFTRDWATMVGAEHVIDDSAGGYLYLGAHDSPMIARAGAFVQGTISPLDAGEPQWVFPIAVGISAINDTGVTGEVEVVLSPAMPSSDFWVVPYPLNEPLPPGGLPRPPWVRVQFKTYPGVADTFRFLIQKDTKVNGGYLDNGGSSSPSTARDLSFGFLVYHP